MTEWWTSHDAALIGAIGGSAIGILGGLLGTLMGVLAPRGIGRPFVIGGLVLLAAAGLVGLTAGIVGVARSQPYHVYYPLLLGGGILTLVTGPLVLVARAVYRRAQANRLSAEELRRA